MSAQEYDQQRRKAAVMEKILEKGEDVDETHLDVRSLWEVKVNKNIL